MRPRDFVLPPEFVEHAELADEPLTLDDESPEALWRMLDERGWGDGLPVVAPTPARVEAALAEGREEVIRAWVLPLGDYETDYDSTPPLSFASIDLLRRSEAAGGAVWDTLANTTGGTNN